MRKKIPLETAVNTRVHAACGNCVKNPSCIVSRVRKLCSQPPIVPREQNYCVCWKLLCELGSDSNIVCSLFNTIGHRLLHYKIVWQENAVVIIFKIERYVT